MTLSLVVPVYNVGGGRPRALASITREISASGASAEVIVVDDGSSDGSAEALDGWKAELERLRTPTRIRVIHQANQGVSSARNRGLELASGRYVWFVDADDEIASGALSVLLPIMEGDDAPDIISIGYCSEYPAAVIKDAKIRKIWNLDRQSDAQFVLRHFGGVLWAWNGLFRREVISGIRFKHYPNGEDTLWGYEALLTARTFQRVDLPLYVYRDNAEGASRKLTIRHLESLMGVGGELVDVFRHARHFDWYRRQLMRHLRGITHNGARVVTRALGAKGYSAWCDGARKIYLDSGIVQGWRRLLCQILLGLGWPWLVELFCFCPVEWKGWLVRMIRKCG